MKRYFHSLALICLALPALWGCQKTNIYETVKAMSVAQVDTTGFVSKTLQTNQFTSVEVDCFADVTYHQTLSGTPPRVVLSAPPEVMDHLSAKTENGELGIHIDRGYQMPNRAIVVVHLYSPFVSSFSLQGGKCLRLGQMSISSPLNLTLDGVGALTAEKVEAYEISAELNGAGNIDLHGIRTERLTADLNGAGNISLAGTCTDAYLNLNGAGNIDISGLKSQHPAQRSVNGVGNIKE